MPGFLVHRGATVQCKHQGLAQPIMASLRVKVGGQAVVTMQSQYTISACALTGTPTPPCVTAMFIQAATRVKVQGQPVVLKDSQSMATPTGTPLTIVVTQQRVRGR
jgi:hypothetical protein